MKKINSFKNGGGFTVIEALVSISILLLVVTGAYSAAQSGISSSVTAKDRIIAFYLAQEGVEVIKNKRDGNALQTASDPDNPTDWLYGFDSCTLDNLCTVVPFDNQVISCEGGHENCPNLNINSDGQYNYNSGEVSIFKRSVAIDSVNEHETVIISKVTWTTNSGLKQFIIKNSMFNWNNEDED